MLNLRAKTWQTSLGRKCLSSVKPSEKEVENKAYKNTVLLPVTEFPQVLKPGKVVERDRQIQKEAGFLDLYAWQRKHVKGKEFVLHDGPPYANGKPHIGHAINKILKDIVLRSQLVQGNRVHYKPGWDCHGLPIEMKAIKDAKTKLSPNEIRQKARDVAHSTSLIQMQSFKNWGVIGDWENQCYYTYDNKYVSNQLQIFWKLYNKGLIYYDLKPVYWSPSSRTALAESELEYKENHISNALTVRFKVTNESSTEPTYLLIWTTTPWTLPANRGVCYSNKINYSLVKISDCDGNYIVASDLMPELQKKFQKELTVVSSISPEKLSKMEYVHPWWPDKKMKVVESPYTTLTGTGFNHTAPAHGHEDFLLGLKYNLGTECFVDEKGRYSKEAGSDLHGLKVLEDGSSYVIEKLKSDIIHKEDYKHSYPYDWRTGKPVIIRASKQWFIDTESLQQQALESLSEVSAATNKIQSMLQSRDYWCLSRQRAWGVPIPAFYNKHSGRPLLSKGLIDHLCRLFESSTADAWWTEANEILFPSKVCGELFVKAEDVIRGNDIMDIWFDSGVSWSYALDGKRADLCLEGIDQYRGWFQSLLLTSVAVEGKAPYRKLIAHGFAVDEKGKKMSKSLGNVVDPNEIIEGNKALGIDAFRWWVSSHAHHAQIPVSNKILESTSENVKKIRLTLRFLLGALKDLTYVELEDSKPLLHVDRYLLNLCHRTYNSVVDSYNKYQHNHVCITLNNFIANDVSGRYVAVIKDRLYCDGVNSERRKSCRLVLNGILNTLCHCLAPVLPHLAEEVFAHHPLYKGRKKLFYNSEMWKPPEFWKSESDDCIIGLADEIKRDINAAFGPKAQKEWCEVAASKEDYELLKKLQNGKEESNDSELTELLQVSGVRLKVGNRNVSLIVNESAQCARCRRFTSPRTNALCSRCEDVVSNS